MKMNILPFTKDELSQEDAEELGFTVNSWICNNTCSERASVWHTALKTRRPFTWLSERGFNLERKIYLLKEENLYLYWIFTQEKKVRIYEEKNCINDWNKGLFS